MFQFTVAEIDQLLAIVMSLASGHADQVEVHHLPFVTTIGGCCMTFRVSAWDQAIVRTSKPLDFECRFTTGTWDNIAGLMEPFVQGANGFQWLAGPPGEAALLLSDSGQW
jgi:hypothetical protein